MIAAARPSRLNCLPRFRYEPEAPAREYFSLLAHRAHNETTLLKESIMYLLLRLGLVFSLVLTFTFSLSLGEEKNKKPPVVAPREGKSETIELFNGKDLDGWAGHEDLWSVKDGVIVAKNDKPIK